MSWVSSISGRTMLIALAAVGSLIYIGTAYTLTHYVEGVPKYVTALFALASFTAISLAILVAASLLDIYRTSRAGLRGAKLHRRLVGLLSLVAVLPALSAFVLTGAVLRSFSDEYFVERVTDANLVARDLANGYVNTQSAKMGVQVIQLARDLGREANRGLTPETTPVGFRKYLLGQTLLRGFSGVTLVDRDGRVIAAISTDPDQKFPLPPASVFAEISAPGATPYKFNALDQNKLNTYYAAFKLGAPDEGFLIAYQPEHPALSEQLLGVRAFRDQTAEVRERLADISRIFGLGYGIVMLLLLLGAVWAGLLVSNRIVAPVRRLATASEQVSAGNLQSRVNVQKGDGELGDLGRAFNNMTEQLQAQRDDLIAAHAQSDTRRRFIETVVAGVPAGVLNVSVEGRIALANPSADYILGQDKGRLTGSMIDEVAPELTPMIARAESSPDRDVRDQVELQRRGDARIINVRISADDPSRLTGYVITLDDITELVAAQRNAAWGDVARRIAHEIKNPLTPIQLSAERLRRRYGNTLGEDREVFDRCTDTIIRHVGDIGRMVNEFSSFARMPEPIISTEDLCEIARSSAFSFTVAHPQISFEHNMPDEPIPARCDGRLIGQAVVNLVKNAVESIEENQREDGNKIIVTVRQDGENGIIEVSDTGRGLPSEGRSRLTEPYMTTRAKGTGLGLAIVRKAVEEHGGTFSLIDKGADDISGATARIILPLKDVTKAEQQYPKPNLSAGNNAPSEQEGV